MAKISAEARKKYLEKVGQHKSRLEELRNGINAITAEVKGGEGIEKARKRIAAADETLNMISYLLLMNNLSLALLGIKNDSFLNEARKACYNAIIQLEKTVTSYIDVPFSEYEEGVLLLEELPLEEKWQLIRKLGYTITALREAYGDNSKWKWSFVELEGRYAVIVKNFINLKSLIGGMDPRVEGYNIRLAHLRLAKRVLQEAADNYRAKYELSTLRIDDFKLAIEYLGALKRLSSLIGEPEKANELKKKIDIWRAKMESDSKKKEKSAKRPG